MRIDAGQLERAAEVVTDLTDQADRHGFDFWVLAGTSQRVGVDALRSLASGEVDRSELNAQVESLDAMINTWRDLQARVLLPFYDGILARLLTAAGRTGEAQEQLNKTLRFADETGVHYYDAQLLRLRAQTQEDGDQRGADIAAAIELARRQGAAVFELQAAADDVEQRGRLAHPVLVEAMAHFPPDSTWPGLARAHALLR